MRVHVVDLQLEIPDVYGDTPEEVVANISKHYQDVGHLIDEHEVISAYICVHDEKDENSKRIQWIPNE